MPRSYTTLTLDDAKRMLAAAEVKAGSFGIAYNIAVVDAGGHLLAFVRQDRKSTRLNSSHLKLSRMPSSA